MPLPEDADEPILIGLAGPPYAGKSRLAKSLNRMLHGRFQVFYLSSERESYKSVTSRIDNGRGRDERNIGSFMSRFDDPPLSKILDRIETIRGIVSARKKKQEKMLMKSLGDFKLDDTLDTGAQLAVPEPLTPRLEMSSVTSSSSPQHGRSGLGGMGVDEDGRARTSRGRLESRGAPPNFATTSTTAAGGGEGVGGQNSLEGSLFPRPPDDAPPEAAFFRNAYRLQSSHFFASVTATYQDYEFVPMVEPLAVAIKQQMEGKNFVFIVGTTFLRQPEVREKLDHCFYLNISAEVCKSRLLDRNSRLKLSDEAFEPEWRKYADCTDSLLTGIENPNYWPDTFLYGDIYFINSERPPPIVIVEILRHLLQGSSDFAQAPIEELSIEMSEKELETAIEEVKKKEGDGKDDRWWAHALRDKSLESIKAALALEKNN